MRSYDWWQKLLADRYFGPQRNGRPVLLFIDDKEAASLFEQAPDGIVDLRSAVVAEIDWYGKAFEQVLRRVGVWKKEKRQYHEPPPFLPLLAVSVLAATRMRGDGSRGRRPYYDRLAEVLAPKDKVPVDVREHLKRDYDSVRDMWESLGNWLMDTEGKYGIRTFYAPKGFERIGYAMSQAIMCADDNDRLVPFFQEHGGKSGQELVELLRVWPGRHRLSRACRDALESDDRHPVLAELLETLATAVSSALEDARPGKGALARSHTLQIVADQDQQRRWELSCKILYREGIIRDALRHDGGTLHVAFEEGRKYYQLSGDLPDVATVLDTGFTATGKHMRISVPRRSKPIILQQDPSGGYVETANPQPDVPSLILYSAALEKAAKELMEEKAGYEWEPGDPSDVPGWFVIDRIEFDAEEGQRGRRFRLKGGLRVRRHLGRNHFLAGGEPDLVPPADADVVKVDGRAIPIGGKPLRLRDLGLAPGEHTVELDGHRRTFVTHEPRFPERRPGQQARGSAAPGRPVAAIHADGRSTPLASSQADLPVWWRARNTGLTGRGPRVNIPESAVWLVSEDPEGRLSVLRVGEKRSPRFRRIDLDMIGLWSDLFFAELRDARRDGDLWNRYRTMALQTGMTSRK
jgi:hypothetical protein